MHKPIALVISSGAGLNTPPDSRSHGIMNGRRAMDGIVYSKYNMVEALQNTVGELTHIVLNSFTGSIDLCTGMIAGILEQEASLPQNDEIHEFLLSRGYAYHSEREEQDKIKAVSTIHRELRSRRENIRAVILTTYSCNLNCDYCYQKRLKRRKGVISEELISSIFNYITCTYEAVASIDVIGGEPLLDTRNHSQSIMRILKKAQDRNLKIRIISNGSHLRQYVPMLKAFKSLDFVQVTIDGPPAVHNSRRKGNDRHVQKAELFESIQYCLDNGLRIAARTNIDNDNIAFLPELAAEYEKRGFLDRKAQFFPYLSPVHEHGSHMCDSNHNEFFILKNLLGMENAFPTTVAVFNKSNFLIYQYLKNIKKSGRFTFPRFYRCEANTNQLVFDPFGDIYTCIEAAGDERYKVGEYADGVFLDSNALHKWREARDVTASARCMDCPIAFICGGNCSWACFNQSRATQAEICDSLQKSVRLFLSERGHELAGAVSGRA